MNFKLRTTVTLMIMCLVVIFSSIVCGETYKWKDSNGIHFTDNASSIPPKYREKVLEEARQNNPAQPSQMATPLPLQHEILPQVIKPENNSQVNIGEKPFPENRFSPPRPVYNPSNFARNQNSIEKTLAVALAPLAGFMLFWVVICLTFGIGWIITLVDIIRSEFTDSSNKVIWLILVLFVPFLGVLLYLIIGVGQKKGKIGWKTEWCSRLYQDKSRDGEFRI